MPQFKYVASGSYVIASDGTGVGPVGYQVSVTSRSWTGSVVFAQNTAPPGSVPNYVNVAYQDANTGTEFAAGTSITGTAAVIISPTVGDLIAIVTVTTGEVIINVNPATSGVTNRELRNAFVAAGYDTAGQDTTEAMLSVAVAGMLGEVLNVKAFGATGDGVTDDTAAIQAALTAAGAGLNRLTVFVPSGVYKFSQLVMKNGVRLIGNGIGGFGEIDSGGQYGTELQQIAGTNDDGIIFVGNSFGGTTYVGPQQISDLILMGDTTASAGSGIAFRTAVPANATIQDTVTLRNLLIRGWKDDGIEFPAGALPLHVTDVNLLYNGRYGINYTHSNTQAVHFANISGDGNLSGLVRVLNVPDTGSVLFTNVKSEKRINADYGDVVGQEDCILLVNCSGPIAVHGLTHISSVPDGGNFEEPGAAIHITGAGIPQLSFSAVAVRVRVGDTGGTACTVKDVTTSKTIPYTVHHGFYGQSGTLLQNIVLGSTQDAFGLTVYPRGVGDPERQLSGVTPMRTWFETDAGTNEKGWGISASGGLFGERTINDDGTSGTVYRSVARSGATPTVVTYEVPLGIQGTTARLYAGSGAPEGAVTAAVGSIYLRTGGGAGTSFYVKESGSGNTGWVGK